MTVAVSYPHVAKPAGESAHLIRLPRIRVAQIVMDYQAHGWSAQEMCWQHPHLKPAEVHSAMAYYFDNQSEIDAEIQSELEQVRRERAANGESPIQAKLRAKGLI
jgi:uncharacterized protein (DUF433 family)